MNKIAVISIIILTSFSMKSQSLIAKTEDGRRVILNKDKSWEFIDNKPVEAINKSNNKNCIITKDYVEPKSDKNVTPWLKKFDATTDDLKKHVAVDNDCNVSDVILLNISEQKGNGIYSLCVKGTEMKYRRAGSVFFRADEDPLSKNKF